MQIEGEVEKDSEVRATYRDLEARRPVINKLYDHTEQIQPHEAMEETSEYRSTINKLEVKLESNFFKSFFKKPRLYSTCSLAK